MTGATESQSEAPVFWTKGTIAFFIGIGTVLLFFFAWLLLSWSAKAQVEREIAKLRAAGQPVTPEEAAPPLVAAAENAAPLYQRAIIEMKAAEVASEDDDNVEHLAGVTSSRWFDADCAQVGANLDKARAALGFYSKVFPLLDKAAAMPRCRFDNDYAAGFAMEIPHMMRLREIARVLRARAFLRAHEGDLPGALRDVEGILALDHAMRDEPVLISQLVRVAIARIAVEALAEIAAGRELPEADALRLAKRLMALEFWSSMRAALAGERTFGLSAIETVLRGDMTTLGARGTPATRAATSVGGFWLRWNQVTYIEFMSALVAAAALPPDEALAAARDVEDRMQDLSNTRGMFAKLMLPSLSTALARVASTEMYTRTAAVGLMCDLYARRLGRMPADVAELVPEFLDTVPIDAFTRKPLTLSSTKTGFIVYSVGTNETDEGGRIGTSDQHDIGWIHSTAAAAKTGATSSAPPPKKRAAPRRY